MLEDPSSRVIWRSYCPSLVFQYFHVQRCVQRFLFLHYGHPPFWHLVFEIRVSISAWL